MRFPGFEGEWEYKKIKQIAIKINSGKTPLGGEAAYSAHGIVFIRSQNVNDDKLILDNITFISPEINHSMRNSVVQGNDILLNITGASLGRSCVVPENFNHGNVNQHVCIIRLNQDSEPRFLQPFLSSDKGQKILTKLQTGSGREGLNFESIKGIRLGFPGISEQQKIASFLSLIDERIKTQSKIIEDVKRLKQSLIRKIFSRKLKFKNRSGNYFGEWRTINLGEITTLINKRNKENKKLPVYSINNKSGFVPQGEQFEGVNSDERGYDIKLYKLIERNTFAYNPARINVGSIGYSGDLNNVIISSLYVCFQTSDAIDDRFLFQYFKTDLFNKAVLNNVEGGVRDYLFYDNFARIEFLLPELEEQTKIADFLKIVDNKIETELATLNQMENQKKFLLRNLFI